MDLPLEGMTFMSETRGSRVAFGNDRRVGMMWAL
jgi:hypothetical protein